MSRNWTENQKNAIHALDGTILVSAAAGSGKTAVLVQRVIELITHPTAPKDADRLLVVTYTHAAADEMRERISSAVEALLEADPSNSNLRRQQILLNNAKISTIHSFCSELVRENFHRLQIAQNFRIADEGELSILRKQALDNALDELYTVGDPDFHSLVECFSDSKSDRGLREVVLKGYNFLRSQPFPKQWMEHSLHMYKNTVTIEESLWGKILLDYGKSAVRHLLGLTNASLDLLQQEPEVFEKAIDLIGQDKRFLLHTEKILEQQNWNSVYPQLTSFEKGKFPTIRGYTNHPAKVTAHTNRKTVADTIETLSKLFAKSDVSFQEELAAQYPVIRQLFQCITLFADRYEEVKISKKMADFSDLEHWALKLLVEETETGGKATGLAEKIADTYDAVMVDEYQDANEVQELLFRAVSKNDSNLFVVGDVKQSIYGFRQATPQMFINRKERYSLYDPQKNSYPARIVLDKNFRSRKEITESVNFIFDCLMSKEAGDIAYNTEERLAAGADYPVINTPATQLHLLEIEGEADLCETEADYIAGLIMDHMANSYLYSNGERRRPAYGDFAILLRSADKYSPIYVKKLIERGIPACSQSTDSFLAAKEIQLIINFLKIIDNPLQDIPLASVLLCPIYGFTPDDMAKIRIQNRYANFYTALKFFDGDGETKEKCGRFLQELSEFRTSAVTMPVDVLVNVIYEKTSFLSVIPAMCTASNALNNLRLFQEYARNFESSGSRGLSPFVTYMDKMQKNQIDLKGSVDIEAAGVNAVKVMSIHKSKGLEFPICILANTSRDFVSDTKERTLIHNKLGFATKRKEIETMALYDTIPRQALVLETKRAEKSEELRVLYVALTRPKEKLIILGSSKNLEKTVTDISMKLSAGTEISPYVVKESRNILTWVIMCALLHPSGELLRLLAGRDPACYKHCDTPPWHIQISGKTLVEETTEAAQPEIPAIQEHTGGKQKTFFNSEPFQKLMTRINYSYKNQPLCALPVKVAASELAHKDNRQFFSKMLSRPAFLDSSNMTSMEKGTALHNFFQYCDFVSAKQNIQTEIERLVEKGFLSEKQKQVIDMQKAQTFLNSPIVTSAVNSPKLYKEYRFTIKIQAGRFDAALQPPFSEEPILLQGAIDLAYLENGKLVIVDYKTDKVKEISRLADLYQEQLLLYKEAMEQCTDYTVSKCIIYSMHLGSFIQVDT